MTLTMHPPKTLYQLLCRLLQHSGECQTDPPNFLDQKNLKFKKFHGACDTVFHSLHESGIGTKKKSANVLSKDDENKLWTLGILNIMNHDSGS